MKLWGFLRFEMNAHKPFSICGYSFQNELGFQRDGSSFGAGFPIGAGSTLLAGESKGDSVPLAVVSKGGSAALAGGIQWRAGPPWQEESNETGGFVAHDFVRKV